ncbi:DUF6884 domain-containing protein [Streptomyces sp. NPDC020875]|uniref:DUF6884 domain-containing protein n=1 Tax=Streptomyces sp. NPDC020875 TaxID=3154898 RepID=UPI00340D5BE1
MGDRFTTPEDVAAHWRIGGGDQFRITETKDESASRMAAPWQRERRASEMALISDALVVARMHYSDTGRYRWGIFHTGTALPVLMMEAGQDGEAARALAEALDQWRDAAGEAFDWSSEGLVDRVRSPYGQGMLDQVRGRDPEARWAGSASADADVWETDDGQAYVYDDTMDKVSVYDPDGLLIARAERQFDRNTRKSAFIGEMRDGRRLSGEWARHFVENAVWQHRIAQLEPAARDDVWIYYLDHRPIVHGVDKYAADHPEMKALLRSAGFTWSGFAKAYVTTGTTRSVARAQGVDRLARALYEKGRMVEIRADENRLRGVHAPAVPPPAAARTAVPAVTAPAEAPPAAAGADAPAAPVPEPGPVLAPQDLTADQISAELERLNEERRRAPYGSARRQRLDEQIAPLKQEHDRRQVEEVGSRADPAGMEDGEIAAEREALAAALGHPAYGYVDKTPLAEARRERDELLRVEQARRTAAELEARTPVAQMTDEDLQAEGAQLVKIRHQRPPEAADAFGARVTVVGREIAERRLRAWGEQPPVAGLDDDELTGALETLRGQRLSDTEFAGSDPAKELVEEAFKARRHVLGTEVKERDEKAFRALLETDGRIRLKTWSHNDRATRVKIDNRWYGEITDLYSEYRVQLWRGRGHDSREVTWRTGALRWLIGEYEKDPETYDTRTWGAYVDVELPPSFVDQLTTRFSSLTLSEEAEKYLITMLADSSRTQSQDEHGKKIMVHALDVPRQALPVLEQMGRRLVGLLDDELDCDDRKTRERAKRARPHVLRALDDLAEVMGAQGLEPLRADNENAGAAPEAEGEGEGERVREDGPAALGDVPAQGAGRDGGPGAVLPGSGGGRGAADRGAGGGEDARGDGGDRSPAAGGQAEHGAAGGAGAGAEGDRVSGAGGGAPGRGAAPPVVFRPVSQDDLAPAGERAKAAANLEAVRVLKLVREEQRAATAAEQQVMARWSGWGAVPEVLADRPVEDDPVFGPGGERENGYAAAAARWESFADVRDPLRVLLDDGEWRAAAASTLSAHYTPPEITSAMWQALADLGFDGGEVLEPGSGAGVTFGTAPESARLTGIEIDPTSAAISRLLAPGVTVLNESFADTVAPDGAFDAVVGNVPFARVTLYDPKHNRGRHRIHNHFVLKSLALTRPGGVVALIASGYVMDTEGDKARAELFEMADLLGAVRLPRNVFARSAGTNVFADILILRRRMDGEEPLDRTWLNVQRRQLGDHVLPVNDYFVEHPERVLGTLTSRMGRVRPEVAVFGDPDVSVSLRVALRQIADSAVLARRSYAPHPEGPHRPPLRLKPAADIQDFTGRLSADVDGKLWQAVGEGDQVAVELPAKQHAQLASLIELKDLVRGLNELDRSGSDRALADAHRRLTKETYERYVAAYGPLSRPRQQQNVTTQTGDGASVTGLTAWGYFLNDPQAYEVLALEMWEADTETVRVSEILDRAPAARRSILGRHTDDPQQALDAVVAERGHVDLPHIAWMLQVDEDEARRRLGRSVFTDPLTSDLLYSADYLSGDVRTKLEIARQAARQDAAFQVNVAELERILPREMLPGQFAIRLGAAWLPDDLVQEFFRQFLGDAHLTIQHSGNGNWHILKGRGLSEEDEVKHTAGGLDPLALVSRVLNGGSMTGRPADDEEAAHAVRTRAEEWRDAFEAWVLDDSARAARVADVYNRQMNNRVVRDFTGTRPSLAGLDPDFTPYDHQLAAAARMAHERCLVLSHVVGAGKTGALAIGMMAMKNTGQIEKPLVAVPNYLVEQWEGEVRKLFPAARILTLTSDDLADGKRDRMLQYVRANSFDMIIMSHSLFDSIPLSPEFYEFYNDDELRKMDAQIVHERRREGKSISLKQLEERRQTHAQKLKERADSIRTPGQVYMDDLGLDFFAIDEAHEYKNLAVQSKIPGARVKGSAKAQHLHAVLEWARRNKPTGPMGCLATGTPLSNAIGELHSLLLLANPQLLRDLGIEEFDAFATMYGKMVERLEMTVDGKGFKSVERFAAFHSVNSLLRQLWLPAVDYKDEEDLGLPLPGIKGGEPELMLVPATPGQQKLMEELGERYEACHQGEVDKSEDNALSINTDARVIALDPRLIDADAEPGNKLRLLADRIAATYHETKDNRYTYTTKDLRPHPVPGALQMVFLNQGTPGGKNRGNFNAYQEMKDLLVERDVPADKIDFIHDASRADQRRKLVARANHGGCNVLIGSTQRMGKGLNAQNRTIALYHVDPDFRPADMKQKDGRALRQGNQNKNVGIVWAATEGTFDSRMYGILATKAKGFDQLYKARLDAGTDEIQEVDEALVPYEEAQAIISGNEYLIAQEDLRKKLKKLTLSQNNRATQRSIIFKKVQAVSAEIEVLERNITRRGAVLPSLLPVLGDDFQITLGGASYTKHKDAAVPLTTALSGVLEALPEDRPSTRDVVLGQLGGRDLVAVAFREDNQEVPFVRVHLDGLPDSLQRFDAVQLSILKGEALLRRLTKTITEAPGRQTEDEGNLRAKQKTRDNLLIQSEELRGQVPGLALARERLSLVDALVKAQVAVNKAGKPSEKESADETKNRKAAVERRDGLQRQLDQLDADAPAEASPEAGGILPDAGPRRDPAWLSAQERESEATILRAHITVHGDPDGTVAARLAALEEAGGPPADTAGSGEPVDDAASPADTRTTAATEPSEPSSGRETTGASGTLQGLIDGFGGRVVFGHIGAPPTTPGPPDEHPEQPTKQPADRPEPAAETAAGEAEPAPAAAPGEELWNGVPGIIAGPGVVKPGMHVQYLPPYWPGSRTRHSGSGVIVSVGPNNVRWRPAGWHQDVRTPLDHMRINPTKHVNQAEDVRRMSAALEAGQPLPRHPEWVRWSLAEHLAYAGQAPEAQTGPLVIIPCGSAKLDRKAAAGELYVGPYHRSCREAADALTADGGTVLILSALYGLVTLDQEIEPYDLRMGQLGSVTVEKLREQARELGVDGAQEVVILAGETYTAAALEVWPDAATPLAGLGGLGYQRQYLSMLAKRAPGEPIPQPAGNTDEAADGDGYGTGDLFDEFGVPQPGRVPAPPQDGPDPEEETDETGVPGGQMTVDEVQPDTAPADQGAITRDDGRVRLTSADGQLTFTLLEVPADAGLAPQAVEGYQRRLAEFTAVVETKNEQTAQTPDEQAERLARWRHTYKGDNGLEPFRPLPSLRLTPRTDSPGLTPAEYGLGSWVTWRDERTGQEVTGQVMAPGAATNTWFVSTDRTGHTGEYHVLSRSGKKSTGYSYSLNDAVDLRPADGPGAQRPLEDLPEADSIPARPVTPYADWLPTDGLSPVREPIPVTVGDMGPRFDPVEVAFDVTADGIPFVVRLSQNDETLTSTFVPRIESDGDIVAEYVSLDSRAAAVALCVRVAREARKMADQPLNARYRNHSLDLAGDGICGQCSLHLNDGHAKPLYRINSGDPECVDHISLRLSVPKSEVVELARARRIWAARVAPAPVSPDPAAPVGAKPEAAVGAEIREPHEVDRQSLRGGNRITVAVSGTSIEWDADAWGLPVPVTVTVTGTVYPGYRDFRQNTTLLDAVIRDQTGAEVTAAERVFVRLLPAQVQLIPADHRDDLRPEPRTVGQIRVGDLVAEGGSRGEVVTELRFVQGGRGSMMTISTRDAVTGDANSFGLAVADEIAVVPRERRPSEDVAALFGHHGSHEEAASQVQRTYDLHAAVTDATGRVWPNGGGPRDELRALDAAIAAIIPSGRGVDVYRANSAAMERAAAAAAALLAATDDDVLNRYVGVPLHRLHQHLDDQAQRLAASAAHLAERAASAASAKTSAAAAEHRGEGDQPRPDQAIRTATDALRETAPPSDEQLAASRDRYSPLREGEGAGADPAPAKGPTPAPNPGGGPGPDDLVRAQLRMTEVTGAAGITYSLHGGLQPGDPQTIQFHIVRRSRGMTDVVEFSGTRDECLAYIETAAAVRSAAEAVGENSEQQAAAAEWLRQAGEAADESPDTGPGTGSGDPQPASPAAATGAQGPGASPDGEAEGNGAAEAPAEEAATPRTDPKDAAADAGREAELRAALAEGESIVPVSFTGSYVPAAGWILSTPGGHTFRIRPSATDRPDQDRWEGAHDTGGSSWWNVNIEDRTLAAVLARIREDSATRTRFASLWARYGHLTAQAPRFETTTNRVQLEEGVYLVHRFGRIGLIASCRWGWQHLTDPDGAQGRTSEGWSRKGQDTRQYVAEWKIWAPGQEAIPDERLRVVARLTDDMADTPDAYCDGSWPYVGKDSAKNSGARYTVAVADDQGGELGHYTLCARCLSLRLSGDEDRHGYREVQVLARDLAKGDPKECDLRWGLWDDRIAELAGQMLTAALDAGEAAPWPARALADQIVAEACEAGDDRAKREARAEVKAAGGDAQAQKRAAEAAFAARQDRAALVARRGAAPVEAANEASRDGVAPLPLGLDGPEAESGSAAAGSGEGTPVAVDVTALTVTPRILNGEPSFYQFDVTGPGLTVGEYTISHDAQGEGARGIMWRASWYGAEPSGLWDVISIGSGKGESAALAAVAEHATETGGDLVAGFAVARRMQYDAGLWLLPDVGESESIQYHPDGSWTITAGTGARYTVRKEWRGRTASGELGPLLIEDQAGAQVASCDAVDGYMSSWAAMLERLRLHASSAADEVPHATLVTLGGPGRDWVEAWCVCSWTERADAAEYADRLSAGEALALAHNPAHGPVAPGADAVPRSLAEAEPVRRSQSPESSNSASVPGRKRKGKGSAVVAPTLDDVVPEETSGAPAAPEPPDLDVVLLNVDVPVLGPAEPYTADEEAQADIDRLGEAFALWEALPEVQRYYDADRRQRPDGDGPPANAVAQLAAAYRDAEQILRDGPVGSPDDLVRQVHTVAVWSGALEPVVGEDLRGPLVQVREAADLMASRSRATVEAFETELAALAAASAAPAAAPQEKAAAEPEPAEPAPATGDDRQETPDSVTGPESREPAAGPGPAAPPTTERTTAGTEPGAVTDDAPPPAGPADEDGPGTAAAPGSDTSPADEAAPPETPVPDREPDGDPAEQEDTVAGEPDAPAPETTAEAPVAGPPTEEPATTPVVDVEDPPEPRRHIEVVPLSTDPAYELHLVTVDGQPRPVEGGVRHGDRVIAEIRESAAGSWYARLAFDGLPADVTGPHDTPRAAGAHAAILYSAFTGTPYGEPVVAATASGPLTRADVVRRELREAALWHREAVTAAAARADTDYAQNPAFQELDRHLGSLAAAVSGGHGSRQMEADLIAVRDAVNAWGVTLPENPDAQERQHLVFPLARLLYDAARLRGRLQATLDAVQGERDAAARERDAREAAAAAVPDTATAAPSAPRPAPVPDPASSAVPVPGPESVPAVEPVTGPTVTISLSSASEPGEVLARIDTVALSQTIVLPGAVVADMPGQLLPVTVTVPMLDRPAQHAEQLVSDEETAAWLAPYLAESPLAPAWSTPRVRPVLVVAVGDVLRDGMAPTVDEVADWLVATATERDGLLQSAHTTLAEFTAQFEQSADALVANDGSELLWWTYMGNDGARRAQVLAVATPTAYEQLRALPLPAAEPAATPAPAAATEPIPAEPAPSPQAPEESEMSTPPQFKPGDLPLWTGPDPDPVPTGPEVDLVAGFEAVKEAWDEHVPADRDTGEGFAAVRAELLRLRDALGEPGGTGPAPQEPVAAASSGAAAGPGAAPEDTGAKANAVNTALRAADEHAPALADLPEWQRLQTVRGAFSNLMSVLKKRAGEGFEQLMTRDGRFSDFIRRTSLKVCEKVAELARAGADRLRKHSDPPGRGGDLPSAEALLRLGDAAFDYAEPRRHGPPPAASDAGGAPVRTVDIPEMRKMGEALARPLPGQGRKVSAAAARGRSTTAKRSGKPKKPTTGGGEQSGHLRRGTTNPQQGRKPNQR